MDDSVYAAVAVVSSVAGVFVALQISEVGGRNRRFEDRPTLRSHRDARRLALLTRALVVFTLVLAALQFVVGWGAAGFSSGWPPRLDFWLVLFCLIALSVFAIVVWLLVEVLPPIVDMPAPVGNDTITPAGAREPGFLIIENSSDSNVVAQWVDREGRLDDARKHTVGRDTTFGFRTLQAHIWEVSIEGGPAGARYRVGPRPVLIRATARTTETAPRLPGSTRVSLDSPDRR